MYFFFLLLAFFEGNKPSVDESDFSRAMLIHTLAEDLSKFSRVVFGVGAGTLNQRSFASLTCGYGRKVIHWKAHVVS